MRRAPRTRRARPRRAGHRRAGRGVREPLRPPGSPVPSRDPGDRPRRRTGRSSSGAISSWRWTSSAPAVPSRSSFLSRSAASRRGLRTSTRASSIRLWTTRTRSLRRSSVSGGMFRRTTVPSTLGMRPMSLLVMAFSIAPRTPRSQGWMTIWCGSGTLMPGELVERRRGAVVLDLDALDERGRRAAGADALEVALHGLDGAAHLVVGVGDDLGGHARAPPAVAWAAVAPEMSVPTGSPAATRVMLSGWLRSNTTIGRSFSMHRLTAVASSTLSWSRSRSA